MTEMSKIMFIFEHSTHKKLTLINTYLDDKN